MVFSYAYRLRKSCRADYCCLIQDFPYLDMRCVFFSENFASQGLMLFACRHSQQIHSFAKLQSQCVIYFPRSYPSMILDSVTICSVLHFDA